MPGEPEYFKHENTIPDPEEEKFSPIRKEVNQFESDVKAAKEAINQKFAPHLNSGKPPPYFHKFNK